MLTQLVTPDYNIPYVGGLCEGFVEGTAKQATLPTPSHPTTYGVWANAVAPVKPGETAAWSENYENGNHPGEQPPTGLYVPVFFTLGSTPAGHVALLLPDGRVASSTQSGFNTEPYIHPNMQDLINTYAKYNNGCTYIGWSEYIGKLKIIGEVMFTEEQRKDLNTGIFLADLGIGKDVVGNKSYQDAVYHILSSSEFKEAQFVNGGDVANINSLTGRTDATTQLGQHWKAEHYNYEVPNYPTGTYVPVTQQLFVKEK